MTRKQRAALDFITAYIGEHRISPTMEEISDQLGLHSKGGAYQLVIALEALGHVKRVPLRARSLELLAAPRTLIEQAEHLTRALMDARVIDHDDEGPVMCATEAELRATLLAALAR